MALVPYTNDFKHPVHIAGKMIMPGETRGIPDEYLPTCQTLDLAEFISQAAKSVIEGLSILDDSELAAVLVFERQGKNRSTVVAAINTEQAAREASKRLDEFRDEVASMSLEDIEQARLVHRDDETRLVIIDAEVKSR